MTSVPLTPDELKAHLWDQLDFLKASGASFDGGNFSEARRLAVSLRVLLHDRKPNSRSLLGQLDLKAKLEFIDTGNDVDPLNELTTAGLTMMRVETKAGKATSIWVAPLGDGPPQRYNKPKLDFETWWERPVIGDGEGSIFCRRDLVLGVADKEGAHIDPSTEEAFYKLSKSNSLNWIIIDNAGERPMDSNPVYPSIRQVSWELVTTLEGQLATKGFKRS